MGTDFTNEIKNALKSDDKVTVFRKKVEQFYEEYAECWAEWHLTQIKKNILNLAKAGKLNLKTQDSKQYCYYDYRIDFPEEHMYTMNNVHISSKLKELEHEAKELNESFGIYKPVMLKKLREYTTKGFLTGKKSYVEYGFVLTHFTENLLKIMMSKCSADNINLHRIITYNIDYETRHICKNIIFDKSLKTNTIIICDITNHTATLKDFSAVSSSCLFEDRHLVIEFKIEL